MNILVTGGASGLGKSIVEKTASDKNNFVVFTYANSKNAADQITQKYKNTKAIHCDFKDIFSVDNTIIQLNEFNLDVLINNALTSIIKQHFHKIEPTSFLNSFEQNIIPTIKITQSCIQTFRKKKFGKIINIASSALINKPPIGWSEYVANKAYFLSMSHSWATENIKFNITSNCISPAFMQTDLNKEIDERMLQELIKNHPLKKILTIEEVSESVNFLLNCSQHINGINLIMNAGVDIF
jgi:3-oxoacyl-[acyl-carrier protein] reductase